MEGTQPSKISIGIGYCPSKLICIQNEDPVYGRGREGRREGGVKYKDQAGQRPLLKEYVREERNVSERNRKGSNQHIACCSEIPHVLQVAHFFRKRLVEIVVVDVEKLNRLHIANASRDRSSKKIVTNSEINQRDQIAKCSGESTRELIVSESTFYKGYEIGVFVGNRPGKIVSILLLLRRIG